MLHSKASVDYPCPKLARVRSENYWNSKRNIYTEYTSKLQYSMIILTVEIEASLAYSDGKSECSLSLVIRASVAYPYIFNGDFASVGQSECSLSWPVCT